MDLSSICNSVFHHCAKTMCGIFMLTKSFLQFWTRKITLIFGFHSLGATVGVATPYSEDAGDCGCTLCPLLAATQHLPSGLWLEDVSKLFLIMVVLFALWCMATTALFWYFWLSFCFWKDLTRAPEKHTTVAEMRERISVNPPTV